MTNQNNEQETAALRMLAKFKEKYGELSEVMRSINHWQHTLSEYRNGYSASRVTDIDVGTAEAEMLVAIRAHTSAIEEKYQAQIAMLSEDSKRYQRLRIIGVAPYATKHLSNGTVLRFQNLDSYCDAEIKAYPSRGEATQPTAEAFIAEIEAGALDKLADEGEKGVFSGAMLVAHIRRIAAEKRKQAEQGAQNGNG